MHKGITEDLGPPASIPPPSLGPGPIQNAKLCKAVCFNWRHLWKPFGAWGLLSALRFFTRGQFTLPWASVSSLCNEEFSLSGLSDPWRLNYTTNQTASDLGGGRLLSPGKPYTKRAFAWSPALDTSCVSQSRELAKGFSKDGKLAGKQGWAVKVGVLRGRRHSI